MFLQPCYQAAEGGQICLLHIQMLIPVAPKVGLTPNQAANLILSVVWRSRGQVLLLWVLFMVLLIPETFLLIFVKIGLVIVGGRLWCARSFLCKTQLMLCLVEFSCGYVWDCDKNGKGKRIF